MKYNVLCLRNDELTTDTFHTEVLKDHSVIAKTLKKLYEGADVEVLGVTVVSEMVVDLM